jgi:glycosyltransferase involved in cell wall biosynthesis
MFLCCSNIQRIDVPTNTLLKILLTKINNLKVPIDILVVDDNSKDGTKQFLLRESCKKKS